MPTDLRALLIVLERERERRDAAMLALRDAERRLAQAQAQGLTLLSYRDDTAGRWVAPLGGVTTLPQLQTARDFLQRLDAALQQHEHEQHRVQSLVQQRRAQLLAAETRLASLDKLVERRQRAHRALQHRREQLASDERAQLIASRSEHATHPEPAHEHPDVPQA